MDKTLVVLAAGIGTRYGGLKQLDPVGPSGEFIPDYAVYDAVRAGFTKVVFVIRPEIQRDFKNLIGARIEPRVETRYVMQEAAALPPGFSVPPERARPWGTGQAVLVCRDAVAEPFAVINADDFYGREAFDTLGRFLDQTAAEPARYAMVGYRLRETLSPHGAVSRGVCRSDAAGRLTSIVERRGVEQAGAEARYREDDGSWRALPGDTLVSMNFWGFKPSLFAHLEAGFAAFLEARGEDPEAEYFVPNVVNALVRDGAASVQVLQTESPWFGVTYPRDKANVVARIRALTARGAYPGALWKDGTPGAAAERHG
ncbi:MAG: nucleotidyltransferase [Lentisphaerae bacterium]|nr:nucleotidyltransferase [Lentisphaerota bacterium]